MSITSATVVERRRAYVRALYGWHRALGGDPAVASQARQRLALLRRGFTGARQEAEAYAVVFPLDPPADEQEIWLLLGTLFALHPHANSSPRRSMGGAMRQLAAGRGSAAVQRRLEQLLYVDRQALPHYLRQAMTLLRAGEVSLDYHCLLNDLCILLHGDAEADNEAAHRVRLQWARDFHRPDPSERRTDSSATPPPANI